MGCIERVPTVLIDSRRRRISGRAWIDHRPTLVPGPMDVVGSLAVTDIYWCDKDDLAGYASVTMTEVA